MHTAQSSDISIFTGELPAVQAPPSAPAIPAAKPAAKPATVPAKWGALGAWTKVGGQLVRVAVGGKGVWGCNKQKQIFYWE